MDDLDAIAPLNLTGVTPSVSGREPQVVWLSIRDLRIDRRYQRGLSETSRSLIRRMVEGWDWALCGPVTVADLPGGLYELIDGQHRATAACTAGLHRLPAVIVEARDTAARAAIFGKLNVARVKVGQGTLFRAALMAGDEDALRLDALARRCGVRIVTTNQPADRCQPGDTLAIESLRRILRAHGETVLEAVLRTAAAAEIVPIRGPHLAALADLANSPEWGLDTLDPQRLHRALDDWDALRKMADKVAGETNTPVARARAAALWRRAVKREAA